MDQMTDLLKHRPAGHRATALELAEAAQQAIDAGAKVLVCDPVTVAVHNIEGAARRFAEASAKQKRRIRPSARAAVSAACRRPKS
ncbi:hypothetical protein [Azospirillum brasilense]|uniref:hypothetical protein n=1 Tax=Azospirillum brasilense TaxID=192 RepID=UPI000E67DF6A|nr:hypothetical protein [Azospirillum brasilense]NUB24294.1 hypothetical protein [Azospirillum brasilense]NUB30096.1 hypothetical protein [Azospirillum brasilense]RIW04955.1 hypothetical protein D2T81_08960 [Azospirillum brasilense]